jgi:methionyl-tRNA synthetase
MRYLLTAALPYANGPLHLGHLAGAYLPADLVARYLRLKGHDVLFVCGSDEHGVPILLRAREEGVEPQAVVDRYHAQLRDALGRFGMSFDHYGRTSSDVHRETSQDFFRVMEAGGQFVKRTEEQLYDAEAGLFLADRFVRGTCPKCGYEDAYGDQCENCGTALSPKELIDPRSTLSGTEPELRETSHWYLPLGEIQPALKAYVEQHPEWKPNVTGQVKSWFDAGLTDRAMTRDLPWGVPVPPDVDGSAEGKVLYVWFDAPIGYVSISKAWAERIGQPERWRDYWQREDTKLVHFIGKDNIVFHTLIFPGLLMAYNASRGEPDQPFVLPDNVPANEFLNLEGRKLSTSRGWAVWAHEAAEHFDPDLLRYALAATLPETKDADFTWADFQARVNNELADVLGNFVHRALTFAHRFASGVVPPLTDPSELDRETLAALSGFPERIGKAYEGYRLREAVQETMALARLGNKYFNDTEPWKTRKTDERACMNTIHVSLQLCAALGVLMEPVVPGLARQLREMVNLTGVRASTPSEGSTGTTGWDEAAVPLLPEGHRIGEAAVLVQKVEDEQVETQRALLESRAAASQPDAEEEAEPSLPYTPVADTITYDDFAKLDLRTGVVLAAEPHPKADRLLRLDVDLGFETRQLVAGLAEHYAPEEVVGKRVVVVANLAPRKLRGLESQGMVLMAEDREGRLHFVGSEAEGGSRVQ